MRRNHLTWLIVAGVIAFLLVFLWPTKDSEQDSQSSFANESNRSGSENPVVADATANSERSLPSPSLQQEPAPPEVIAPIEIEVCGVGTTKLDLSKRATVSDYADSLIKDALPRWVAALRESKDIHAKAMGLLLQTRLDARTTFEELGRRAGPCEDKECQRQLRLARSEIGDHVTPEVAEELVHLANSTRDPAVYALSAQMCRLTSTPLGGPCNSVSIEQWMEVDPDNAVPRLAKGIAAIVALDRVTRDEARQHAANAQHIESYRNLFFKASLAQLPANLSPLQRSILAYRLLNMESLRRIDIFALGCSPPWNDNDAMRHDACNSLAELYSKQGTTLSDHNAGLILGKWVGWPGEKTRAMDIEQTALFETQFEQLMFGDSVEQSNPFSCDAVQKRNALFEKVAALGELAALRNVLEVSGVSMEEMNRRREEREKERARRRTNLPSQ